MTQRVLTADTDSRFVSLGSPRRIWAISAIHGEAGRLMALHDALYERIEPGDRLLYHGNYIGYGPAPCETIDELLTFRRMVLALPGMIPEDIIYLRGRQEEMWQKLKQVQFAPNPTDVLLWMLSHGLSSAMKAYGICPHEGINAAREGIMPLTRWTGRICDTIRKRPGHEIFNTQLRRAAHTQEGADCPLLFVHAGLDPDLPLANQGDNFWWTRKDFNHIELPYAPFQRVIRGFDPAHEGLRINCVTATIDGGCGFGGSLVAAGFDGKGEVFDLIEA